MFTGIIETLGSVQRIERADGGMRLAIEMEADEPLRLGESVALNGVCLTAAAVPSACLWEADVSLETMRRTALGDLRPGALVHLERALKADGRLGGHFVQGHVDETGIAARLSPEGAGMLLDVRVSSDGMRYLVEKGSVSVDGVSLTVASLLPDGFQVALVPHTLEKTTFARRSAGSRVNLEFDILAKYVERALTYRPSGGVGAELLKAQGYMR